MAGGIEVEHVSDISVPLIEGAPAVDDRLGSIRTRDRSARRWLLLLYRDDGCADHQLVNTP